MPATPLARTPRTPAHAPCERDLQLLVQRQRMRPGRRRRGRRGRECGGQGRAGGGRRAARVVRRHLRADRSVLRTSDPRARTEPRVSAGRARSMSSRCRTSCARAAAGHARTRARTHPLRSVQFDLAGVQRLPQLVLHGAQLGPRNGADSVHAHLRGRRALQLRVQSGLLLPRELASPRPGLPLRGQLRLQLLRARRSPFLPRTPRTPRTPARTRRSAESSVSWPSFPRSSWGERIHASASTGAAATTHLCREALALELRPLQLRHAVARVSRRAGEQASRRAPRFVPPAA